MPAFSSPRIGLSYLAAAQAQKHVTVNESLGRLDAVVQASVLSMTLGAEPAAPAEGDAYILPPGATGAAWSAIAAQSLAVFQDGAFAEIVPWQGFLAYVADEGRLRVFDGSAWSLVEAAAPETAPLFGVNTAADGTNRLAVKSDATLLSHDDVTPGSGDHRVVVNKSAAGKTASIVFQDGFSGRGEIGLIGNDEFAFKVSADGASFKTAMRFNQTSANVTVGDGAGSPAAAIHVRTAADPAIRLEETGATSYAQLRHVSSGQSILEHVSASGQALIDLSPVASDGTSNAMFRFFRGTTTTHACTIDIHRGDGTFNSNHTFSGKSHTYLNRWDGFAKIGGAGSPPAPVCTLDVEGPVRVKSYTVATVPSAAAGAGQIIFVSDEAGGAVLAFSDGTSWRRVTDRAVIA